MSQSLALMFVWGEKLELSTSGQLTTTRVTYGLPGLATTDYRTALAIVRMTYRPVKGMEWTNDIVYNYSSLIPAGYPSSWTIWSTRLSYSFLEEQRLTAYCLVSDVLNKSNNVQRSVTATEVQTTATSYLRRCILVELKYRFNKFGVPVIN